MRRYRRPALLLALLLSSLAPLNTFACAACYGAHIDDAMANGMNWAILTLGVIIVTVLGAFLTFLIYAIRKSEAVEAARQQTVPTAQAPIRPAAPARAAGVPALELKPAT
jgi:heme/copper-type cytochrome/quinol oxidase subunit 2